MQLVTQEVLEVLDELETPRRRTELLNFLYSSNYYANNDTGFKDNSYLCNDSINNTSLYYIIRGIFILSRNVLIIN